MFVTVEEALQLAREGKMLIIADDGSQASQGSLFVAAERADKDTAAIMTRLGRGAVHFALPEERLETLGLPGSAAVRAGFPLLGSLPVTAALKGGVMRNAAHAEAAVDLAAEAGLAPAGVFCGIAGVDGAPLGRKQWAALAEAHGLKAVTIEALIAWRKERGGYVTLEAEANLPTAFGLFRIMGFINHLNGEHHVALVMGEIKAGEDVLVRVHSECLTGDAFHSLRCDCGEQLTVALTAIAREGRGILLYLRQEGRGIGLINKIKAYKLQEQGLDTEEANIALGFPADMRDYGIGAQILSALNATKLRLMTNNPKKLVGIRGHGIEVVERVPLIIAPNEIDRKYLQTKRDKMGHVLPRKD
jgi:3,4-dihydroxy 2-butanone 4-phosphate synthase/GTP cyclohydrolase II